MNTYTITELDNYNSTRVGNIIKCKNLTTAKKMASRSQAFYGTVLTISVDGNVISYKENGKWNNTEY